MLSEYGTVAFILWLQCVVHLETDSTDINVLWEISLWGKFLSCQLVILIKTDL